LVQPPLLRKGIVQTHVARELLKVRTKKPQREDVPDDPTRTVHALVRKFKAIANNPETAKEVHRQVRQEAKDLNIATLFQYYLYQGRRKLLEPISPNKI
jgi:GTP cyclohydrolase I